MHFPAALRPVSTQILAVAAALLAGGCAHYTPATNMALFARKAPALNFVPRGKQLATAEARAAQLDNAFALIGSGRSMEPMYPSDTAIVVRECSFQTLKTGMPVVYRNRRGFYVAHMLVDDLPGGWLAIGLNNTEPDDDLVTPRNFVGVITDAYAPTPTQYTLNITTRPKSGDQPST